MLNWQSGSYPVFQHFCQGLGYCTWAVVGQFPVPYGSGVYSAIKCACLYVLSCSFTVRSVQGVLLSVAQF